MNRETCILITIRTVFILRCISEINFMAIPKQVHLTSNHVAKSISAYDIEVSGNWRRRNKGSKLYLINSIILVLASALFSMSYVFVVHNVTASCALNTVMLDRIKLLEARVTLLESSTGSTRTEEKPSNVHEVIVPMQRRKRSVESGCREENRGQKRAKSNRTRNIDIRAVQFRSSNPGLFAVRPLEGVIGPWDEDPNNIHKMDSLGLRLVESERKLEFTRAGMYFIYSQVTCPARNSSNSYSINVISADEKTNTPISICNAADKQLSYSEVSCFTATLRFLKSGDIVYLQQIEQHRGIDLESSSTYFGVILLNG